MSGSEGRKPRQERPELSQKKMRIGDFVRRSDDSPDSSMSSAHPASSDSENPEDRTIRRREGHLNTSARQHRGTRTKEQGTEEEQRQMTERLENPSIEEAEDGREISRADTEFLRELLKAQKNGLQGGSAQVLLAAFQTMKDVALRRAIKVAHLEGELRAHTCPQHQVLNPPATSYRQALERQGDRQEYVQTGTGSRTTTERTEPKVLLVESKDAQAVHPEKVREFVQKSFDPKVMGLKTVALRPIGKGVAVVADNEAALERLASAIQATPAMQALTVRRGGERKPTYKLVGVDPCVEPDTLVTRFIEQNDLAESTDGCRVVIDTQSRAGKRVVVLEVTREISHHLYRREKIQLGWTVCALFRSPNITRCTNCARYGHSHRACRQRAATCMHCSGPHPTNSCNSSEYDCPACSNRGIGDRNHSMTDFRCPVYCQQVEWATQNWG